MGIQGLRKFIGALSCTKTIYPREARNNKRSSSSSLLTTTSNNTNNTNNNNNNNNNAATSKRSRSAPVGNSNNDDDAAMQARVAQQVANIFNKQSAAAAGNTDGSGGGANHNSGEGGGGGKNKSSSSSAGGGGGGRLPAAHHVLFDLNSLIHSCFNKLGMENPNATSTVCTAQNTINAVKARIEEILTTIVTPTRTLTICVDGPAPLAKLRTQRMRRRRVNTVNMAHLKQFSELSITTGSSFLVKLERELALFLQERYADLFGSNNNNKGGASHNHHNLHEKRVAIYLNGSTSAGEGESKISQMLAFHAYNPHTPYNPNDTVVIIGNDIDLTLTGVGCMYYHNTYVLSASSLQAFSIGDIIYRWVCPGSGFLQDAHLLPSVRADLVYLFSLNGGDHFAGVGEAAADMWRRYKLLRATNPSLRLVSDDLLSVDLGFLGEILQVSEYDGQADASVGLLLLRASLWSTFTIITGVCPDYRFTVPDTILPTVSNIKAAIVANKHNRNACSIKYNPNASPLTPLATFTAAMPTIELFPEGVLKAYNTLPPQTKVNVRTLVAFDSATGQQRHYNNNIYSTMADASNDGTVAYRLVPVNLTLETIKKHLGNINDTHMIVSGVEGLIKMAEENGFLSAAEKARNTFTSPVFITAPSVDRMKRIAELTRDIGKGRHLPENVKRKKEEELKALHALGPAFEIKPIVVRQPTFAASSSSSPSSTAEGGGGGASDAAGSNGTTNTNNNSSSGIPLPPLSIDDNYYDVKRNLTELLFTNIFNYNINADFEALEAVVEQRTGRNRCAGADEDRDNANSIDEPSFEEQMVGEELNSFDSFLKKKRSGNNTNNNSSASASALSSSLITTSVANNNVRRVPIVQSVPKHLEDIRYRAVKLKNRDEMQREFTSMLKGKRGHDVPDDDERGGGGGGRGAGAAAAAAILSDDSNNNNNANKNNKKRAAEQTTAPKKRGRMEDDEDYDEDAMADLDIDDDDDDGDNDNRRGVKKGRKETTTNKKQQSQKTAKKGSGRSLADLSDDDDGDDGYVNTFADNDVDFDEGGEDGFGGGGGKAQKKKSSTSKVSGANKKVTKKK